MQLFRALFYLPNKVLKSVRNVELSSAFSKKNMLEPFSDTFVFFQCLWDLGCLVNKTFSTTQTTSLPTTVWEIVYLEIKIDTKYSGLWPKGQHVKPRENTGRYNVDIVCLL